VLALAETAILEQKAAAANEALAAVRLADPNNPRIALLDAQVAQLGLRAKLDEARLAIGELRFDEAEALIAVAGSMQGGESVDVNLVSLELATARNQARVAEIIAIADERAAAGLLLSPPNDSARFHYELALIKDPGNQSALQGLTTVASKLVDHAVQAIELARFDEADSLLRDAAAINPSSTELSAGYAALAAAREAVAEAERQAEAARVAELERQAEAERQAELKRQQEIQQQAELERQAVAAREAERLAELELLAERERQAALEKQAQLDRLAELERQAEVERQAALKRQAELEKQAELQRLADLERQAEQERLAEIAQHEEDARVLERQEAERQAVEQNAAAAAASSVVGVAAAKAQPAPKAAPQKAAAVVTPPAQNRGSATAPEPASLAAARQTEIEDNQALLADSGAANVVVTDVAPAFGLGTGARQAQVPAGLPQFAGSSIGSFATNGADAAAHQVVPISSLTRTNYVPPVYPRAAQRKNLHGAVEVEFTVDRNGAVTDLLVIDSNPGDTFSQAALDAVQQWRFEPVVVDGRAVEKRTAVKLHFDLE
jgi:TonB family protein